MAVLASPSRKKKSSTLSLLMTTQAAFVDSADQDQTTQNVQSYQ